MKGKAMQETIPFNFKNTSVRVINRDGEPWFVATDVAEVLGLTDSRKSVGLLDEDERNTIPVTDSLGRNQNTHIISESGLYSLVLRSRKPEAKEFKRWITREVIPSIRKTGAYGAPQLTELPLLAPVEVGFLGGHHVSGQGLGGAGGVHLAAFFAVVVGNG